MANQTMTCPRCSGTMEDVPGKQQVHCPYCDYVEIRKSAQERAKELHDIKYAEESAKQEALYKQKAKYERNARRTHRRVRLNVILALLAILVIAGCIAFGNDVRAYNNREEYDPFAAAVVEFSGRNESGRCSIRTDSAHNAKVKFAVEGEDGKLFNGQEIAIYASSSDYKLTETRKTFIVSGLDTPVTEEYLRDSDVMEFFHTQADVLNDGPNGNCDGYSFAPNGAYLVTTSDGKSVIYEVKTMTVEKNGCSRDFYQSVIFSDAWTCSGIAPAEYGRRSVAGSSQSVYTDPQYDGTYAFTDTYCGACFCFTGMDELESRIMRDVPTAAGIVRIDEP